MTPALAVARLVWQVVAAVCEVESWLCAVASWVWADARFDSAWINSGLRHLNLGQTVTTIQSMPGIPRS